MKYVLSSFLFIVIISNGCLPKYYSGIHGSHVPPLISAPTKDAEKHSFMSVDINNGMTWEENENNVLFKGRYLHVWSTNKMDANIGFLAHGGRYEVSKVQQYKGNYGYYGFGVELDVCRYWSASAFDSGLGFHIQGVFELGEYYTFRKDSENEGLIENMNGIFNPMLSFFPLIRYNISDATNICFQCAVGLPGLISPSLSFQNGPFVYWASWNPATSGSQEYHDTFSIGIGVLH